MKVVIDIPEEQYEIIKELVKKQNSICPEADSAEKIILNGTPLPKGHGRLIDGDSLIKAIEEKEKRLSNADTIYGLCRAVALIFDESTIIEADKESEEEE